MIQNPPSLPKPDSQENPATFQESAAPGTRQRTNKSVARIGWVFAIALFSILIVRFYSKSTYYPIDPIYPQVTYTGKPLGIYYLDDPKGWQLSNHLTDSAGFATINSNGVTARQPVTHSEKIFDAFHQYAQTGSQDDANKVLRLADLLVADMETATLGGRECTVLWYNFPWMPWEPNNRHWKSAMAQGLAMSALCRAYEIQAKPEYLQAAKACMAIFDVDVKDGGVVSHDDQGNTYYEEYAISGRTYHVLNGFIYCLLGLYDLYRATGDLKAKALFEQGIRTLTTPGVLERYDKGFWTTYDQSPFHWPSFKYSAIHIRQLRVLYHITGLKLFDAKADKWQKYNLQHKYRIVFFFWGTWKRAMAHLGVYTSTAKNPGT